MTEYNDEANCFGGTYVYMLAPKDIAIGSNSFGVFAEIIALVASSIKIPPFPAAEFEKPQQDVIVANY